MCQYAWILNDEAEIIEDATNLGDMWVLSDWLGYLWTGMYAAQQWVYQSDIGWLYVPEMPELESGFWFYSNDFAQWIWFLAIFSGSRKSWMANFAATNNDPLRPSSQ